MKIQLLQYHITWMSLLGLWPKGRRNFYGIIHTLVFFLMQSLNLISGSINFIHCNGNLNCLLESVTYLVLILCSLYISSIFILNEKLYQTAALTLHIMMEEFKTQEYTINAEKFTRRVTVMCIGYYTMGLLQYNIAPLMDYNNCIERDTEDSALICGLPSPGWFPFDPTTSPGFPIAYVLKCIWATLCIKSVAHPIMLSASIIYHIIAHLQMIQDHLQKMCDGKFEGRYNFLRTLIRHHTAVLNFSDLVSGAFNQILLMYGVLITVIFSVVGFQILQMFATTIDLLNLWRYIMVLGGYFIILLILSLLGQKLIDESTAVADFAYETPWYDESVAFQQMIQLIILRANKPLVLRSAHISDVSFPSFSKVMSTTYSYLAMMYNVLLVSEEN